MTRLPWSNERGVTTPQRISWHQGVATPAGFPEWSGARGAPGWTISTPFSHATRWFPVPNTRDVMGSGSETLTTPGLAWNRSHEPLTTANVVPLSQPTASMTEVDCPATSRAPRSQARGD